MENSLIIKILDEIVSICEDVRKLKEDSNKHIGLKKILKEKYNLNITEITSILENLDDKVKSNETKQIEKLNDKLINFCKIVNINHLDKDDKINYSKIRSRVSNKRHSLNKKNNL